MEEFKLEGSEFIELHNLLKIKGLCESGGMAKAVIAAGLVTVDGNVELRKRCKIRSGQVVVFDGHAIAVQAGPSSQER
jgi:ribosome-associated protein